MYKASTIYKLKYQYSEFLWSVFSPNWTEYGESKCEKILTRKTPNTHAVGVIKVLKSSITLRASPFCRGL